MSWITPLVEIFGGAAIFLGIFISITAIPLIVTMMVAMFGIHVHYGFSAIKTIGLTPQGPLFGPPGYEINLLYICGLTALLVSGSGKFSIDAILAKRHKQS